MFAKPRAKKVPLPPPVKKRKTEHALEEVTFDPDKRADYLTGFHKRKQARIKQAQEVAQQQARQLKIETRKRIKQEREREAGEHVQMVQKLLREAQNAGQDVDGGSEDEDDEWKGIPDEVPEEPPVNKEEEYLEEDRFTTVTVEAVTLDRDGLHKIGAEEEGDDGDGVDKGEGGGVKSTAGGDSVKKSKAPKAKKKKFRYENKTERKLTERKQKAKKARR